MDLVKKTDHLTKFKFPIKNNLLEKLSQIFPKKNKYIGYAVGAGEKNRIWNLSNFIDVAYYFQKKGYESVFFLGPNEVNEKNIIKKKFKFAIFPEDLIDNFSGPEIVIASTKYLKCSLCNDSGVGHYALYELFTFGQIIWSS